MLLKTDCSRSVYATMLTIKVLLFRWSGGGIYFPTDPTSYVKITDEKRIYCDKVITKARDAYNLDVFQKSGTDQYWLRQIFEETVKTYLMILFWVLFILSNLFSAYE